jgi:DNA-directed RNA polymerase specialized sigma24 family protein
MRQRQTISKDVFWLLAELARMKPKSKGCKGAMLVYCEGLTQMEAANRLDCDQSSIARPCSKIKRVRQVVDSLIRELA